MLRNCKLEESMCVLYSKADSRRMTSQSNYRTESQLQTPPFRTMCQSRGECRSMWALPRSTSELHVSVMYIESETNVNLISQIGPHLLLVATLISKYGLMDLCPSSSPDSLVAFPVSQGAFNVNPNIPL